MLIFQLFNLFRYWMLLSCLNPQIIICIICTCSEYTTENELNLRKKRGATNKLYDFKIIPNNFNSLEMRDSSSWAEKK